MLERKDIPRRALRSAWEAILEAFVYFSAAVARGRRDGVIAGGDLRRTPLHATREIRRILSGPVQQFDPSPFAILQCCHSSAEWQSALTRIRQAAQILIVAPVRPAVEVGPAMSTETLPQSNIDHAGRLIGGQHKSELRD